MFNIHVFMPYEISVLWSTEELTLSLQKFSQGPKNFENANLDQDHQMREPGRMWSMRKTGCSPTFLELKVDSEVWAHAWLAVKRPATMWVLSKDSSGSRHLPTASTIHKTKVLAHHPPPKGIHKCSAPHARIASTSFRYGRT